MSGVIGVGVVERMKRVLGGQKRRDGPHVNRKGIEMHCMTMTIRSAS